jgi:hypothetical protein
VSDEELKKAIIVALEAGDLNVLTKKQVRKKLEDEFKTKLRCGTHKRKNTTENKLLRRRFHENMIQTRTHTLTHAHQVPQEVHVQGDD